MPRLSFWALGVLGGFGVAYGGYYHAYIPQRTAQLTADERLERRKKPLQDAIHAYSRLQAAVEQQVAITPSSSLSLVGKQQDTSAWRTNAEKIIFFCDVQRLRALLLGLSTHVITEKDLCGRLQQLSAWEARHCTELNFRSAPLSCLQTVRCAACFVLYLLCFRMLSRVLGMWSGSSRWQVWLQHSAAARITEALEIQVHLTAENTKLDNGGCQAACGAPRRYITLNTTHWIEEVGFWACPNNPLLHSQPGGAPAAVHRQDAENYHVELLRGRPTMASSPSAEPWCHLLWCGPSGSATAYTTTYAEHWRRLEALLQERLSKGGENREAGSLMRATEVSLGYPVLSNTRELECDGGHAIHYIPVGISGLPHLLYVDAAHAKADVRPHETREETYARVQRAQFVHTRTVAAVKRASADSTTATAPQSLSRLQEWRIYRSFPCWHRVWWGSIYGGGSRRSSTSLHYHLGNASTATEYASAAMAASKAAETFAAAL
ncbi:hypothetical protein JKF63_01069 [Porcisia hertigi]|uniref:Uncharacterized protein n=1 Tax=Porcisia hertigi TaxID=2761500 RepID=A0A836I8N0_9TRYP|nr:hypothetical protein JKF63_01069 [Porcisia hertigi]